MLLANEFDNFNEPIKIFYSDRIAFTPVYKLILQTHLEIIEKNLSAPYFSGLNDFTKVIYAEKPDGTVLGGLAFTIEEQKFTGEINLSFTHPLYRRRGINTICFRYLEKFIKDKNLVGIVSFVHLNNIERLKAAEKCDFMPYGYYMFKKV